MRARRRNEPWQPIPTVRVHRMDEPTYDEWRKLFASFIARRLLLLLGFREPDPDRRLKAPPEAVHDPAPVLDGEPHEHERFYHPGKLDEKAHKQWLRNPHRHIHGITERKRRAGDPNNRIIWMYTEPGETKVDHNKRKMRPPQASMGGREWDGLWDNIVRALEDAA